MATNYFLNLILYVTIFVLLLCIILSLIIDNTNNNTLLILGVLSVSFILFNKFNYDLLMTQPKKDKPKEEKEENGLQSSPKNTSVDDGVTFISMKKLEEE